MVVKILDLHAVRSGRVCGLVRWLSDVTHSNESQGDSPNKIGVIGCARGCGGGGFVFYRRFGVSGACVPRSITMQRPTGTKDAGTPADSLSPSLESYIPLSLCRERRSKKVTHFPALGKGSKVLRLESVSPYGNVRTWHGQIQELKGGFNRGYGAH